MCYLYLVHSLGIDLSQGIWHVLSHGSEFEIAGVLTVFSFTQDLCRLLSFLHINRADRNPTCSLDPFHVSLVHSLDYDERNKR